MQEITASAQLRAILESGNDAVFATDPDGIVTLWSRAAETLFGYGADDIVGKEAALLTPPDRFAEESAILDLARTGERVKYYRTRKVTRTGGSVEVSATVSPIVDENGIVSGVLYVLENLDILRELESAKHDQLYLGAIIASAEEGIIAKNLDGIVTNWNPAAQKIFGYTAEEMIGKPIAILIPPDHPDEEPQILQRIRRGERIEHYETHRVRKDGRTILVALTVSPIKDSLGRVIGASKIVRDISDRARREQAERDQLFLAALVASAEDAVISKDLNGLVTSWNPAAERIYGYTAEEMIGKPMSTLVPPDHPDEEPMILERIRRGERIEHYETQRIRKDGTVVDVALTVSPIRDAMGRVVGASKIARNIGDRKRWEKADFAQSFLGALVDSAEDAIIGKTLQGIVTSWNPAAEKLYGYSAKEMIGKPVSMLVPSDHPDEEPQILDRIRRGERIEHYETKRVRKDGSVIDVALTVSPIRDSLGRIIGASKIARDITEQKRAIRREKDALSQALEAKRAAEEASQAKDEFLATVSHELRTPLTAIVGWCRMAATGELAPEALQRGLQIIDRNARAQAQLVEDLLDISRIVSGKLRVEFKPVDLAGPVSAAVDVVTPAAEAKRIRIRTILSSGVGRILGDFDRLQQVVWNLLSNAIKFTPAQGTIQIELQRVESQIELRISDSGIGISPEFLPHVFSRFSQADGSITRSRGGLGMGLAIVKSLVELQGGTVSVTSAGEGQGSTFTVKFPVSVVRSDSWSYPAPKPPRPAVLGDRPELVGLKLLVVDDEPDTRDLLRFVLNQCGAIVETAKDAEMALQMVDNWKPDLLISDIGMPGIDGYELIRLVRSRKSRIPAIALTAMARIDDRIKALDAGYQMHVSKPVEPAELISIVISLLTLVDRRQES